MKSSYSHITLVCDRSGSMMQVQSDAEGAVNTFINDQKNVPGEATLMLIEFDAPVSLMSDNSPWYHIVHSGPINDAPIYKLHPRGNTALNDAVGKAIVETGDFLNRMRDEDKPEHVFFVVQTDGQENSSREWSLEKLRDLIKEQTDTWKWQFVFLGMGPDSFQQGVDMGMNVTRSAQAGQAYRGSYTNTSNHMAGMRTNTVKSMAGTNVTVDADGTVTPASEPSETP